MALVKSTLRASIELNKNNFDAIARSAYPLVSGLPSVLRNELLSFRLLERLSDQQMLAIVSTAQLKEELIAFEKWSDDPGLTSKLLKRITEQLHPDTADSLHREPEMKWLVSHAEQIAQRDGATNASGLAPIGEMKALTAAAFARDARRFAISTPSDSQVKQIASPSIRYPRRIPRQRTDQEEDEPDSLSDSSFPEQSDDDGYPILFTMFVRDIEMHLERQLTKEEMRSAYVMWKEGKTISEIVAKIRNSFLK